MPALTRRRSAAAPQETWHIYYGDLRIGSIGKRAGVPVDVEQWGWRCAFYPGMRPGGDRHGSAETFEEARSAFEVAWREVLPGLEKGAFNDYRRDLALHNWKYAMWDAHCRLPTQIPSGISQCFCGAEISIDNVRAHVYAAHMDTGRPPRR
jgi:hypothetical protein